MNIELTQGKTAIIDDDDYDLVKNYKWCAVTHDKGRIFYACAWVNGKRIKMHKLIMDCPQKMVIDHIDHDGLNNKRENLRQLTKRGNRWNSLPNRNSKSGLKYVTKFKDKWQSRVMREGKRVFLGNYDTPEEASIIGHWYEQEVGYR